jgi:DUF1365 family protein
VSLRSSLYVGSVMHRRLRPRLHRFKYRAFWLMLDLDEIETLSRKLRLFSHNASNLFSLRSADHGDGSSISLRAQAEQFLRDAGIHSAPRTISLLCMPRTLGYGFNPLSVYFCRDPQGALTALIYQVHNTFGERHSYVMRVDEPGEVIRQGCSKAFFVSPFLGMELDYDFRISVPGERLAVAIGVRDRDGPVLNAVMTGARRPLTDGALLRLALTIPWVTLKVVLAIHWEAVRLWLKGVGLRRRPQSHASLPEPTPIPQAAKGP